MPPSPKTIEAVARAICENAQEDFDQHPAEWKDFAKVAITAFLAAMKEEGYVMVPVDPTEKMVLGAAAKLGSTRSSYAKTWRAYRAMLAARPDGEG
jgi:hypothetical protein